MNQMRTQKFLIIFGITLIALSYSAVVIDSSKSLYIQIDEVGVYEGFFFECTSIEHIKVTEIMNRSFTLYLLDYETGIKTLSEQSLKNVSVLEYHIDIISYEGDISGLENRWLSILLTLGNSTEEILCYLTITTKGPEIGLFVSGLLLSSIGLVWITYDYFNNIKIY